ncbi:hypothetical protein TWF192_005180 [Orbilia oligospora]|uniref:F-box domain-containing protein n=1 Tax=Orbilia oligospora TaxID=2813651 RepID=A0A6G1MAJ8_ORBOL|nr:hypothetical protein TWF679_004168 [Orbilia oligospora]KAF3226704.1 hypothetical protein TWF191_004527 [Orbilia oligospora]KAF3250741.1 hypothetical protein TWF192_005180 [Orbilia oligospora]
MATLTLTNIPLDIKLEIASSLSSVADFIALSRTCSTFRSIKSFRAIRTEVFDNETRENLTPELIGLWNSLRFHFQRKLPPSQDLGEADSGNVPTSNIKFQPHGREQMLSHISQISNIRRTIRWFTLRFIKHHWRKRPEEKTPTATEISRIDNAFCALWLWMEIPYDALNINPYMLETATFIFGTSVDLRCSAPDAAIRLGVYTFLRARITEIGPLRLKAMDKEVLVDIARISPCLTRYFKIGVPNIVMMNFGLQGIKNLIIYRPDQRTLGLVPCLLHPTLMNRYPRDEHQLLHCFTSLINYYRESSTETLRRQRFWKSPEAICVREEAPWVQPGLDIKIVFWDDERLLKWGYNSARHHLTESELAEKSISWRKEFKGVNCTGCEPGWDCSHRP